MFSVVRDCSELTVIQSCKCRSHAEITWQSGRATSLGRFLRTTKKIQQLSPELNLHPAIPADLGVT